MRDMFVLSGSVGNCIHLEGREYSYFGGNDYLGLAGQAAIREAAIDAIREFGVNFAASRVTTGTAELHLQLESQLAAFMGHEDAVVFASGYLGNRILLGMLADRFDVVLADAWAHPSILDGIPGDTARVHSYRHGDVVHLEKLLSQCKGKRPLVVTDGVFALTGEIAPLSEIASLLKARDGLLVVDDAHGAGVLGNTGRGALEHLAVPDQDPVFQVNTMSKALGAYGGFIAGSAELVSRIKTTSPVYAGSTALPAPVLGAGLCAVQHVRDHPELRAGVDEHIRRAKPRIHKMGYATSTDPTPIVPLLFKSREEALALTAFLKSSGVIAPLVDYPVGIGRHLVRVTLSAAHTREQVDGLLELLQSWRDGDGIHHDQDSSD